MSKVAVNFRVRNQEALSALDRIGAALDRDRSYMLNEAMETYLELNNWQVEQIKAGLKEAQQGQFVPQAEIDTLLGRKKK